MIGAITMHTEAPREFTAEEVELLASTRLARGRARSRTRACTRRRGGGCGELEHLTELAETLARAQQLGEVLPAVADADARAAPQPLLPRSTCSTAAREELRLRASAPADAEARATIRLSELGPELARSGRSASVAVPLVADDELLGLISAEGTTEVDLARAAANQTAVAIKKIELIERLTEKNLIKDFFEQLAGGNVLGAVEGRAARLGCDLDRTLRRRRGARPPTRRSRRRSRASTPGSLFDHRDDSQPGAPPRSRRPARPSLVERVEAVHAEVGSPVSIGISNPCKGAASFPAGFEEAGHALLGSVIRGTPGVMTYEELGPYKYLLRMSLDSTVRDSQRDLIAKIAEYDRQRQTSLLRTLEEFLRRRGNISATAEALYVHPNTLRQRLRRIQEISGLDLRKEDWLLIEIAVKMVRLQEALGTVGTDITRRRTLVGSRHRQARRALANLAAPDPERGRSRMAARRRTDRRRHPQAVGEARNRVLLRAVRGHVRAAERQARAGSKSRRPRVRRSGLRRLRRRRDRAVPERPRHRGDPRPRELHAGPLGADGGALRLRHPRRRRGVGRTTRARSSARQIEKARTKGFEFKIGLELEYFLVRAERRRLDRARRRRSTPSRSPATTSTG